MNNYTANNAVRRAVHRAVSMAVYNAVDEGVYWTVFDAMYGAVDDVVCCWDVSMAVIDAVKEELE